MHRGGADVSTTIAIAGRGGASIGTSISREPRSVHGYVVGGQNDNSEEYMTVVQIGRNTTRESGCDLASGAKYTQDTIHRVMRTRSGKALQAVAPASGIIPEDRPIKWVWGNCKKGKSKERLEAYRCGEN